MAAPIKFGVGQSVLRKEDDALIRGKGRYTDDLAPQASLHALVVRSPHAHATLKAIDAKAASSMPGVLAVLTGAELATDKIGNLICGWAITSRDGTPSFAPRTTTRST